MLKAPSSDQVPAHVMAQGQVEPVPDFVREALDVGADGWELGHEESGLFRGAGPPQLGQRDAKLFPFDESLAIGKVGTGHPDVVDLVRAG